MNSAKKTRFPLYAFIAFACLVYPAPAGAHLNTTGMGPLYDGLMHFLMSPEDFLPVLALALLAGLRGATYGRRTLFTLPVAWFGGGLAGLSSAAANPHPIVAATWFLLLGGLLAAALVVQLRVHWARIAVRVAGSWIAASGLLMLGWAVRSR